MSRTLGHTLSHTLGHTLYRTLGHALGEEGLKGRNMTWVSMKCDLAIRYCYDTV